MSLAVIDSNIIIVIIFSSDLRTISGNGWAPLMAGMTYFSESEHHYTVSFQTKIDQFGPYCFTFTATPLNSSFL